MYRWLRPVALASVGVWAGPMVDLNAQEASAPVAVDGTVVDAACYLMHPAAAAGETHDECGKACALAGVPLGVIDPVSKRLYLADASGTKLLLPYLHKRVHVSGRAMQRSEPLTLEMPVGDNNKMSVRLDGGYLALTVAQVGAQK